MIKVYGARCVVKEIKNENTTETGIIIPGREKEPTNQGIVIAIGNGALTEDGRRIPMDVAVGDKVVYSSFSGSPVKQKGKNKEKEDESFLILNERDILCCIED